jgi:integrase
VPTVSRRLAAGTITGRLRVAALFLDALGDDCVQAGRAALPAREVTGILTSWGALARCRASPLRVFLRFLRMAGYIDEDLAAVVPRVRRSSPARQAARLTGEQAQRLAASVDARGEAGTRDRAVLLLLWRLGLRADEITRLDLDDIRWRQGKHAGGRRCPPGPSTGYWWLGLLRASAAAPSPPEGTRSRAGCR